MYSSSTPKLQLIILKKTDDQSKEKVKVKATDDEEVDRSSSFLFGAM